MKHNNTAWQRTIALIKTECTNYDAATGDCLPRDCPCVQLNSRYTFQEGRLLCKYFLDRVLPLDKALHAQLTGGDALKSCAVCGKQFIPTGNRAMYCEDCREQQRKKSKAATMRSQRAKQKGYCVVI